MPLGIERLNARRQQPNSRIVFIKPLPGPESSFAQDFLERVAAICHPIMKAHHLSVMSLEEYEPNPEFIGRNFNAGEVIQLVLKAPYSGHWMSFRSVVMVMMHELAHCVQMNHSGAFWKVRNGFADEMKGLWAKRYTGDGMWGKGKTLLSGEYEGRTSWDVEDVPRSLCGGTFRTSRGRKRKRKGEKEGGNKLTYAERQQRRIAKKFGVNGVKLGDDDEVKTKLEDGRKPKGKPRVAGSARGRELRAAAALARFGQQQQEVVKKEEPDDSGNETESDYDDTTVKEEEARDLDGSVLLDSYGHGMIKVCEDEDASDVHVKGEMQELQDINNIPSHSESDQSHENTIEAAADDEVRSSSHNSEHSSSKPHHPRSHISPDHTLNAPRTSKPLTKSNRFQQSGDDYKLSGSSRKDSVLPDDSNGLEISCLMCGMSNGPFTLLCVACSHVLDEEKVPGSWKCHNETCRNGAYLNTGDFGLCGVCGSRKPAE